VLVVPIISLQIDDDLLNRFNKIKNKIGYSSKSKALRDCIVEFIGNYEKFQELKGIRIMTINLIYSLETGIINLTMEVYEKFRSLIKTTIDWRIADKKIEILLVIGEAEKIRDFYNELSRIKDVTCSIQELIIE